MVKNVQIAAKLTVDIPGEFDVTTAAYVLKALSFDGYSDNGRSAGEQGYLFKIMVPVHNNRSIETQGQLLDADDNVRAVIVFHEIVLSRKQRWIDATTL